MRLCADRSFVTMALPDGVVIKVMCRGDLDAACTKLGVDMFLVGNDRNLATGEWQFDQFTHHVLIAFIIGMYGNSTVAQHCLGAGCCNDEIAGAVAERILHVPQVAVFFFGQDFQIRHRGVQYRIPVHQALATIDQAFFVQANKNFLDCIR